MRNLRITHPALAFCCRIVGAEIDQPAMPPAWLPSAGHWALANGTHFSARCFLIDQPPGDRPSEDAAEEDEQFGAVAGFEALLGALAEREQAAGQRRLALEAHQCLGADQAAGRPEQGMAALAAAEHHSGQALDRSLDQPRVDELEAGGVGADAAI